MDLKIKVSINYLSRKRVKLTQRLSLYHRMKVLNPCASHKSSGRLEVHVEIPDEQQDILRLAIIKKSF